MPLVFTSNSDIGLTDLITDSIILHNGTDSNQLHHGTDDLAKTRSSSRRQPTDVATSLLHTSGAPPSTDTPSDNEFEVIPAHVAQKSSHREATPDPPPPLSDSDSDSDIEIIHAYTQLPSSAMASSNDLASVQYAVITQPPMLTAGKITPKALMLFEQNCLDYFVNAKGGIADELKVPRILSSFKDIEVLDWIASERDRLQTVTFADFMVELRHNFLPMDWEENIRSDILSSKLSSYKGFQDWARAQVVNNCVLRGTTSHFTNESLRNTLEANMGSDLRLLAKEARASEKVTLKDWIELMETIDAKRRKDLKRQRDYADEAIRNASSKRQQTSGGRAVRPFGSTSLQQNTNPSTTTRCPRLTDAEKDLLSAHRGCFKCRRFYQSHSRNDCPNDFPSGENYRTRSLDDALRAQRNNNNRATDKGKQASQPSKSTSSRVVASVQDAPLNENNSIDSDNENAVYAVFGPTATSAVLGNGSFSEGDTSVSVPPLKSKHFVWKCNVDGPLVDFPVTTSALIDNGAHLVLIRPQLVAQLGLTVFDLLEPEQVDVAFDSSNKKKTKQLLTSYVRLSVTSTDGSFKSKPVYAVIAPGLCMPIILGLPWLEHNEIVCDHAARSCVVKSSNYNLLHPPKIVRKIPPPSASELRKERLKNRELKVDALQELVQTVKNKWAPRRAMAETITEADIGASIRTRIATLGIIQDMDRRDKKLRKEFDPIFGPLPHIREIPTSFSARIRLKNPEAKVRSRSYPSPRKYTQAWNDLIQEFLDSGRIRPSNSPYASPAFLIPKADKTATPRWVNDYRQLNANTITDSFPLPRIDDILNDCAKGKIWAKIDMTNAFFQTRMHPDDVKYTAVNTPLGLYEWLVMPQGLRNAPSIHQRRVTNALRKYIGKICHIYLDDIVIWSNSVEEHEANVRKILQALQNAKLHINPKKCDLFCSQIHFLGHKISNKGIEADEGKADRILAWPQPKSAQDVRSFLGLVRYLASFLPNLAEHAGVLTQLTLKHCDAAFPQWTSGHQHAFDSIKRLVSSRECLTTIDHNQMPSKKIFVTTDASDMRSGAVLSFGDTWETARPVAFDSSTFKGPELNYPVHEKEMLAIIRALKKWRTDLIGVPFYIYTDHKTLQNFSTQRDLSRRQARWMEFLSQYDGNIIYVKGEDNTVADALSRLPVTSSSDSLAADRAAEPIFDCHIASVLHTSTDESAFSIVGALSQADPTDLPSPDTPSLGYSHTHITADAKLLKLLHDGYASDPWIKSLQSALPGMRIIQQRGNLWFIGERLVVPKVPQLREMIFRLAHDVLGHFGPDKSYEALRHSFYWPNMRRDLQGSYVPGCLACQHNKSSTQRPIGPLHPLPVPDERCDSVAMDFIGPLPLDNGFDSILTMTDRIGSDVQIVPTTTSLTAKQLAETFFDKWYCENGLPNDIISDRDKLFMSRFWKALHKLTGVKIKASTAYHPQTDGASERTNKTVIQALRFHVKRNQKGWVRALPRIRFHIMNTMNKSTKFTPFQLRFGRSPRVLPPLLPSSPSELHTDTDELARQVLARLQTDVRDAQDNLLLAKITQAAQANKRRTLTFPFKVGQRVRLSSKNRRRDYKSSDGKRVAKFIARFDGPYPILAINEEDSTVTLDLPNSANFYPVFHTSEILPFTENDDALYPARAVHKPPPVVINGEEEHFVDHIVAARRRGRGWQYLVRWRGEGPEGDIWLPRRELDDCEAFDNWLTEHPGEAI